VIIIYKFLFLKLNYKFNKMGIIEKIKDIEDEVART